MPAEPYHDFPLSPNRSWDASAAEPGLRRWASSDGSGDKDKIDWGKLKKVYFWHEAGELRNFEQLKFPYCRIENGEPHVVHNAVQNALARIENSDIPADDKPAVRRVAERQMARFQDEEEGESKAFENDAETFVRKFGEPTLSQLEKINRIAKRPLSKDEVFVYTHKMAGDMIIPNRYIQLSIPLLEIFVENANAGVSFLLDHSWAGFGRPKPALPYGRVFEGWLSKDGVVEGETLSFNGTTYIVRGQEKDGISTDAIISDIETGVLFDTSIGWGADKFECSICGEDIRNLLKCPHIPGKKYIINEETNEVKLCWVIAKPPGYLMEDSAVFDGAYPGAGTSLCAVGDVFENEHGIFTVFDDFKQIPLDTRVYGTYSSKGGILTFVKKANHKKVHAFSSNNISIMKGGESRMNEKEILEKKKELLGKMKALGIAIEDGREYDDVEIFKLLAENIQNNTEEQIKLAKECQFLTQEQATEKLGKEYTADEVLRFAKEGIDYHKQTVEDAIAWGVRAMGNDFPADTWRNTFAGMSTQAIKDIAKTWEAQAKATIPAGRRTNPALRTNQENKIPDEAFKVK